jgi:hypothetical protein
LRDIFNLSGKDKDIRFGSGRGKAQTEAYREDQPERPFRRQLGANVSTHWQDSNVDACEEQQHSNDREHRSGEELKEQRGGRIDERYLKHAYHTD